MRRVVVSLPKNAKGEDTVIDQFTVSSTFGTQKIGKFGDSINSRVFAYLKIVISPLKYLILVSAPKKAVNNDIISKHIIVTSYFRLRILRGEDTKW
jgi:hypothetical protein